MPWNETQPWCYCRVQEEGKALLLPCSRFIALILHSSVALPRPKHVWLFKDRFIQVFLPSIASSQGKKAKPLRTDCWHITTGSDPVLSDGVKQTSVAVETGWLNADGSCFSALLLWSAWELLCPQMPTAHSSYGQSCKITRSTELLK